ncbi:hypothetical protein SPPR111872_04015 [Sphingobacterium prati]
MTILTRFLEWLSYNGLIFIKMEGFNRMYKFKLFS